MLQLMITMTPETIKKIYSEIVEYMFSITVEKSVTGYC